MNTEDLYWERYDDFLTENDVDARWILKSKNNDKSYGSLRIVSHPDLRPGYLRAIYTVITSISKRSKAEIMKSITDYHMDVIELEVYNVKDNVETDTTEYEAPFKELENLFKVKIFI
jgi:hypothetical protein